MSSAPVVVSAPQHRYEIDDALLAARLQEPKRSVEVPEALVHDLWQHQRFDATDLTTTGDAPVRILDPGTPNTDAGPDFRNAHVRIGEMDWRGHVEIHVTSSGWFEHDHNSDPRYDSVVLHVTLHADMWTGGLLRSDETTIPEVVLYPHLDTPLRTLLHAYRNRPDDDRLPCASRWDQVPASTKRDWIRTLAQERLADKRDRLADPDISLETALQERLFAGLGYAKNDEPMSTLAHHLPPETVRALDSARDREALHLGVADLLPAPSDLLDADRATADYAMDLRDRFRRLQVQRKLPTMEATQWTFFRLRPSNFPPLRIAQAAAWYDDGALLATDPLPRLRAALDTEHPTDALLDTLTAVPPPFWKTHYHLEKPAAEHSAALGPSRRETLLVNAVVPVLLLDADRRQDEAQTTATLDLLHTLSAAEDRVVRRFQNLGTTARSALDAQGMHQLYREYCTKGGCLHCEIGRHLLDTA